MPMRKQIATLKDLCISNVTRNIVWHGNRFQKSERDGNIYTNYKFMQFLFTDEILNRLLLILWEERRLGRDLGMLKRFLLEGKELTNPLYWPSLHLLFNEYTTIIQPPFCTEVRPEIRMSKSILNFVTSKCKNLKKINETFCLLAHRKLCRVLPGLQNLREVTTGIISDEQIISKILESCLFIKRLTVEVGISGISDEFLFSLCKHCSQHQKFILCPENGQCLKAGKYLENLHIFGFDFASSGPGFACALQHLPVLKTVDKTPISIINNGEIIVKAITLLQNTLRDAGKPPLNFELTAFSFLSIFTTKQLQTVLLSCPKLEAISIDFCHFGPEIFSMLSCKDLKQLHFFFGKNQVLSSRELGQFLNEYGKQIKVLSFRYSSERLDLTHVNSILDCCCYLEDLCVWHIDVYERCYSHLRCSSASRTNLKKITLCLDNTFGFGIPQLCRDYFCKLLCDAENVKKLCITRLLAEEVFSHAMAKHQFRLLEELGMLFCGTAVIPMDKLVTTCTSLKKIKVLYSSSIDFDELWMQHFKENNYAMELLFVSDIFDL